MDNIDETSNNLENSHETFTHNKESHEGVSTVNATKVYTDFQKVGIEHEMKAESKSDACGPENILLVKSAGGMVSEMPLNNLSSMNQQREEAVSKNLKAIVCKDLEVEDIDMEEHFYSQNAKDNYKENMADSTLDYTNTLVEPNSVNLVDESNIEFSSDSNKSEHTEGTEIIQETTQETDTDEQNNIKVKHSDSTASYVGENTEAEDKSKSVNKSIDSGSVIENSEIFKDTQEDKAGKGVETGPTSPRSMYSIKSFETIAIESQSMQKTIGQNINYDSFNFDVERFKEDHLYQQYIQQYYPEYYDFSYFRSSSENTSQQEETIVRSEPFIEKTDMSKNQIKNDYNEKNSLVGPNEGLQRDLRVVIIPSAEQRTGQKPVLSEKPVGFPQEISNKTVAREQNSTNPDELRLGLQIPAFDVKRLADEFDKEKNGQKYKKSDDDQSVYFENIEDEIKQFRNPIIKTDGKIDQNLVIKIFEKSLREKKKVSLNNLKEQQSFVARKMREKEQRSYEQVAMNTDSFNGVKPTVQKVSQMKTRETTNFVDNPNNAHDKINHSLQGTSNAQGALDIIVGNEQTHAQAHGMMVPSQGTYPDQKTSHNSNLNNEQTEPSIGDTSSTWGPKTSQGRNTSLKSGLTKILVPSNTHDPAFAHILEKSNSVLGNPYIVRPNHLAHKQQIMREKKKQQQTNQVRKDPYGQKISISNGPQGNVSFTPQGTTNISANPSFSNGINPPFSEGNQPSKKKDKNTFVSVQSKSLNRSYAQDTSNIGTNNTGLSNNYNSIQKNSSSGNSFSKTDVRIQMFASGQPNAMKSNERKRFDGETHKPIKNSIIERQNKFVTNKEYLKKVELLKNSSVIDFQMTQENYKNKKSYNEHNQNMNFQQQYFMSNEMKSEFNNMTKNDIFKDIHKNNSKNVNKTVTKTQPQSQMNQGNSISGYLMVDQEKNVSKQSGDISNNNTFINNNSNNSNNNNNFVSKRNSMAAANPRQTIISDINKFKQDLKNSKMMSMNQSQGAVQSQSNNSNQNLLYEPRKIKSASNLIEQDKSIMMGGGSQNFGGFPQKGQGYNIAQAANTNTYSNTNTNTNTNNMENGFGKANNFSMKNQKRINQTKFLTMKNVKYID